MLIEGCKHEIEIVVPVEEIDSATESVVSAIQKKARLPGFRPGKAPASLIRTRFAEEVRQDVLEKVVPKYFRQKVKEEDLAIVGTPNIKDVQFEKGEPLRFKADFEVAPVIELKDYRGIEVEYHEPEVSEEDIANRLEQLREQKAQYVNVDPRQVVAGDYVVVALKSISGAPEPIHNDEMTLHVGDADALPGFTEALVGMSPEEEKEFDVVYPDDYGQEGLAGKTVRFHLKLKLIRLKELPELNDEFAQDLGDFQTLDDVRAAVRQAIFHERETAAQNQAKKQLLDKLAEAHDFPVPDAYVEKQIEAEIESEFRQMIDRGIDIGKLQIDWPKLKEAQRPKAIRDVKVLLLLDKIGEQENIGTTKEEVDREVQRIARQEREPAAAIRKKLEKNGDLARIANRIRTDKTVNFLFEHARKQA
ncbi:MAG: trigger factor [Acidobacteriota bacterium]|nr:trigger factor [Acidobacteriota bacterium]